MVAITLRARHLAAIPISAGSVVPNLLDLYSRKKSNLRSKHTLQRASSSGKIFWAQLWTDIRARGFSVYELWIHDVSADDVCFDLACAN